MLFTDIEGSTALVSRLGDRYGEALSAQRALLRACFAEFRGREMGTEGDSFFVVFESAADASGTRLNGVSAARNRVNPAAVATSRRRASPAWAPKAGSWACRAARKRRK